MALQHDGRIVLAGRALSSIGLNYDFAATRIGADGSKVSTGAGAGAHRQMP